MVILKRFLILILISSCFYSIAGAAKNYWAFQPLALPQSLSMDNVVSMGEDAYGQRWLVTEQGLGLFSEQEFEMFRHFELSEPIQFAQFFGDQALLATATSVYIVSLKTPHVPLKKVWQAEPENIVIKAIFTHKSEYAFYLMTNQQLLYIPLPTSSAAGFDKGTDELHRDTIELFQFDRKSTEQKIEHIVNADKGLFWLFENRLYYLQHSDLSLQQQPLSISESDIKQFTSINNQLVVLDHSERLRLLPSFLPMSAFLDERLKQLSALTQIEQLYPVKNDLLILQGQKVFSVADSEFELDGIYHPKFIFMDDLKNIWLSNLFDMQVAWWQPIKVNDHSQPTWHEFDAFSLHSQQPLTSATAIKNGYALKHNSLYELNVNAGNSEWIFKTKLPLNEDVASKDRAISLWETNTHLWLVRNTQLQAINKQTWLVSFELDLDSDTLVMPYLNGQALVVSHQQIITVTALGKVNLKKSQYDCSISCLPKYQVLGSKLINEQLWLATNKGLHKVDMEALTFSHQHQDDLNDRAPVLSIAQAQVGHLWLVYPNKVANFNIQSKQSVFFYSPYNRIFRAVAETPEKLLVDSQQGWLALAAPNKTNMRQKAHIQVKQVIKQGADTVFAEVDSLIEFAKDQGEFQLMFTVAKQHPQQSLFVRFRYPEQPWSYLSQFEHSVVFKNLRQGHQTVEIQARLEGQNWQAVRTIEYLLPYQFFQTKWVIAFVALFLLILVSVIVYERFSRFRVAFKAIKQQAFISSLLESTREGVWVADKDHHIQYVNKAFVDIFGYGLEHVEGKSFSLETDFGRNHEVESLIWQEAIQSGYWSGEIWTKNARQEKISIHLSVTRVTSELKLWGQTDVQYVGVFSDVTDRKKSEIELRHLATRDPLTDLPNRTLFIELVNRSIEQINPLHPTFALMLLDLDNFKKVNENLGLIKGDEFLKMVSERVKSCLNQSITFARMGGDEFALLIPGHLFSGVPAFFIKRVVTDIQRQLHTAFSVAYTEININASMGVAMYPSHGHKTEELMRCADTALNRVKVTGRNNYLIYDHIMDDLDSNNLSLEAELIRAINNDEFLVYYQPKYNMSENNVSGYEALVRWQSPTRGFVTPDQFISLAEQNGLIRQLDLWVLRHVCQQIKDWLKQGEMRGKVAVNISALNFQQAGFCKAVIQVLTEADILPSYIELEITETAMMTDPGRALESMEILRSHGFSIALDDFGTGHSSLGYLKRFPIDRIKIDKTFVDDIEISVQDRNIVSVIIQLAKHLGKEVIAEGVENEQQAYLLHVMGCNQIQGYFISRPIPEEQVQHFDSVDTSKLSKITQHDSAST